jgi:biofilm PGA synthesis protein PgaA
MAGSYKGLRIMSGCLGPKFHGGAWFSSPGTMKRSLIALAILGFTTQAGAAGVPAENGDALYRSSIEDARAGRTDDAVRGLESLATRYPDRQDILGDYAVVLGWAGRYDDAIKLLPRIDRASAKPHVIEGLSNTARNLKQFDLAESLAREAMARSPERAEPRINLALILADAGKRDEAADVIIKLRSEFPNRVDVLDAYAYVAWSRREYFIALVAYQRILVREPANRPAMRGKILTLARIGAPHLAGELADRNPGVLSTNERELIAADRTAHEIRWGAIAASDVTLGADRFAMTDRALAQSDAAARRALDPKAELTPAERQLSYDRLIALRDRSRMKEAVQLYEALAARPGGVPAYVKAAAAAAYLNQKMPEKARDLYQASLAEDPNNLEASLGLFYSLAESEDHKGALAQIDRLVAATPKWIDAWSDATIRENPAYTRVLTARAVAPLYANQPGETEERLRALKNEAPHNTDLRISHASAMRARGWPRAAAEELRLVLTLDLNNVRALGERAGALLETRDYRAAESTLLTARTLAPEEGVVLRSARLWEIHNMRELSVTAGYGRSGGAGPTGTRDFTVESFLYSSPINYNYRVFAHVYSAEARFAAGVGRRNRTGVGVEYRNPLIIATGEVAHDWNGDDLSGSVSLGFTPNDYWTLRGTFDTSTVDTPLQARLAGVSARHATAEAIWRAHESRSAAVALGYYDFSDGNERYSLSGRWTERVISGPVYKLEVTAGLFTSRNSAAAAPYFNPSRDFAPSVQFENEWLSWRRYSYAFRQRLIGTVGQYWQENFGTGFMGELRYEHEWLADDRFALLYGIGRSLHPYDGAQTGRNFGYSALNWRF